MTYYISLENSQSARSKLLRACEYIGVQARAKGGRAVVCETERYDEETERVVGHNTFEQVMLAASTTYQIHRTDGDDIANAAKAWL